MTSKAGAPASRKGPVFLRTPQGGRKSSSGKIPVSVRQGCRGAAAKVLRPVLPHIPPRGKAPFGMRFIEDSLPALRGRYLLHVQAGAGRGKSCRSVWPPFPCEHVPEGLHTQAACLPAQESRGNGRGFKRTGGRCPEAFALFAPGSDNSLPCVCPLPMKRGRVQYGTLFFCRNKTVGMYFCCLPEGDGFIPPLPAERLPFSAHGARWHSRGRAGAV